MKRRPSFTAVLASLFVVLGAPSAALADPELGPDGCPKHYKTRTPMQVFQDHLAAMGSGNLDLVLCNYAPDAVVVQPGSVIQGREAIRTSLLSLFSTFGGAVPTITSVTNAEDVVLLTWTITANGMTVPEAADTFIIKRGLIETQTVHIGVIEPAQAPAPAPAP